MTDLDLDAIEARRQVACLPYTTEATISAVLTITRIDVPALVAEVRRLHALLDRIAYPALMYDARVYMLSEDAPELLDRLNPTQRALVGERPSEVDARVENERDEARATIARVRALCERYERADTERHDRVSVETLAAKVLNALDGAS